MILSVRMDAWTFNFYSFWGCEVYEEDQEGKTHIGVDMGLEVVGDQRLIGVIIIKVWLGWGKTPYLQQW